MLGSTIQFAERFGLQTGYCALENTPLHGPQIGFFVRF
jgi:hypothetical protein